MRFTLWNDSFDVSPVNYVRKANSDLRFSSCDYFVAQSCKKLKTECFFHHRVVRVSNFLIQTGVIDFQCPFSTFKAKVKSYLASLVTAKFNRNNSCLFFGRCLVEHESLFD